MHLLRIVNSFHSVQKGRRVYSFIMTYSLSLQLNLFVKSPATHGIAFEYFFSFVSATSFSSFHMRRVKAQGLQLTWYHHHNHHCYWYYRCFFDYHHHHRQHRTSDQIYINIINVLPSIIILRSLYSCSVFLALILRSLGWRSSDIKFSQSHSSVLFLAFTRSMVKKNDGINTRRWCLPRCSI